MPEFSPRSLQRLSECHPSLQKLFTEVVKSRDCAVLCGYRSKEEQEKAFNEGKSKAHFGKSKHNTFPSEAVDVMPYPVRWDDPEGLSDFAGFVLSTAKDLSIKIRWGGHFKTFFDGPHYELFNGDL